MRRFLCQLVAFGLLSGCMLTAQPDKVTVTVQVVAPSQRPSIDYTQVEIRLQSVTEPLYYKAFADAQGRALLEVTPGRYTLLAAGVYEEGFTVSAAQSEFLALAQQPLSFTMALDLALSGGLIIKQIYYAGSKTPEGANYTKDQFIELYNNADAVLYLDSLCVGALAPANGTVSSNPWTGLDHVGLFQMTWMIPGSGSDYPLQPGESVVLALNAIDHSARCTSGLDLSKAHFGFYDEALSGHEKHPDVTPLRRIFAGQGTAYTFSVHSPAPVIFRPIMGVQAWLDDPGTWQSYQPGSTSGLIYMHIDRSWILDGVECAQSPSGATKRQPTAVDASYTYLHNGQNLGNAVVRRVQEVTADGRVIYMDTNNSAQDFETDAPATPTLIPLWP